jgi:translation elongation factor EF-G
MLQRMHTDTIPIHRSRDGLLHIPGIEIITCAVSNGIHPGVSPNLANLQARRRAVSRVHHEDGGEEAREVAEHAPTAALVFKIMTDAYVGQLAFLRVYSGSLRVGDHVLNTTKGVRERVGRLLRMHANKREEVQEVRAGDIAATVGLRNTLTGATLSSEGAPIILEAIAFPEPIISVAIAPKTKLNRKTEKRAP